MGILPSLASWPLPSPPDRPLPSPPDCPLPLPKLDDDTLSLSLDIPFQVLDAAETMNVSDRFHMHASYFSQTLANEAR